MSIFKISQFLAVMSLTGLLAGCVGPNGRPDYTGSGALIGGASGAAIGAAADRGNPGAGALIGGAAGLITGGLIGHGMDQQAEAQRAAQPPPAVAAAPQGQPLSIADIKAMAKAGVGDDITINQIINTHSAYNLDANDIIDLKNAGVSDKVITYMMNTSASIVATQAPPPPQTEVVVASPGPDYVWVDGDWTWNGVAWVWIGGRWVLPPYHHAIWIGPRWERGPYGWHRVPGHWR
jgi:Glycine zipper